MAGKVVLLKIEDILQMLNISRTTFWRIRKESEFPEPVKLGCRILGWPKEEVERWILDRYQQAQ
ncbi:helix-turn-helix transcriptional regulator [Vibrio parahaemolyticus]|nr:AlpA family phage regulatory protein [Vibrio parahaemolyticus]